MDMDDEAAAMAAAMGFSSFGAQNPSKRRKYNPRADDAVVAASPGAPAAPLPQRGCTAGTGSNNTPLGARGPNTDEIDLDDDDDDNDDEGGASVAAPAPQYIDTSLPPAPTPDTGLARPQVDNIVGSSTLPPRPRDSAPASFRGSRGGREQHGTRDRGGKPWWHDYYDPTSNVNPWEHVEKLHGLEPRGEWLSYHESKSRWEELKPHWDESKFQEGDHPDGEEIAAQPAGPATGKPSEPEDAGPANL